MSPVHEVGLSVTAEGVGTAGSKPVTSSTISHAVVPLSVQERSAVV